MTLAGVPEQPTPSRLVVKFFPKRRKKFVRRGSIRKFHATSSRRTMRHVAILRSRTNSVTALATNKQTARALRLHSLWQVRSVRAMLAAERAISAWSPQISARNRRKHYPRVGGVPLPRKRLTFRARRMRRVENAQRLRRGVPQRRYTDHTRARLQYYFGSVGSAGYLRARRVHRTPSNHSR